MISTRSLSVYYGRQRGIHDLSLSVEPGEVFGFLGPNGAGKTTTLRVLLDIIRPTAGSATIFGLDCQRDGVAIRRRVGYVPGELSLPRRLRADEYLDMLNAVRGRPAAARRVAALCDRLDLDPSRAMGTYSRGNKQKVALVAAFMHEPELLILDEPTSGLDPLVQRTVMEMLRETRAAGRTVFLSSHILPEVQAVCDRVGIVRDGRLVAVERVDQLVRGRIHRLRMRLERTPPIDAFDLPGVREVSRDDGLIEVEVTEGLNQVLTRALEFGVIEIDTAEQSLDEIFMTYYGPGEAHHG